MTGVQTCALPISKVVTGSGQGGIDVAIGDVAAVVPPPNATRDQSAAAERIDRTTQDRLSGNRTLAQYGLCSIFCVASNEFVVMGQGVT